MSKPVLCICENTCTDKPHCNHAADQRLCFHFIDTFEIQNFKPLTIKIGLDNKRNIRDNP